jgi:hypothetical protein
MVVIDIAAKPQTINSAPQTLFDVDTWFLLHFREGLEK